MLNPWGDIITIERALCVTKDGGYLAKGCHTILTMNISDLMGTEVMRKSVIHT